jgi:hypothetical protein
MTKSPIASEIHQPLVRSLKLAAQISLYFLTALDNLTNLVYLLLGEIVSTNTLLDPCLREDLLGLSHPDPKNIRQAADDSLISRKINSCNTWHLSNSLLPTLYDLALALLVLRRATAEDKNLAFALNNFAIAADGLYRRSDLHSFLTIIFELLTCYSHTRYP